MAGYDLEIIKLLFGLETNILLVGDPRQVTYHTHDEAKYSQTLMEILRDLSKKNVLAT